MPISLKSANGAGKMPLGSLMVAPSVINHDYTEDGIRYLKTGFIETDTSKFNNTFFNYTIGTLFTNKRQLNSGANSEDAWVTSSADNGVGTIVITRGNEDSAVLSGLYYSTNSGLTWNALNVGSANFWKVIWVQSLSLFVAVGGGNTSEVIFTSPDGITWTSRHSFLSAVRLSSVAFGNGVLIAVSSTGSRILRSTNGTTWNVITPTVTTVNPSDVTYGNGKFIISGRSDTCQISNDLGLTWSRLDLSATLTTSASGKAIHYADNKFVILFNKNVTNTLNVATSSDGVTWQYLSSNLSPSNISSSGWLRYYQGIWVYTENSASSIITSPRSSNLVSWSSVGTFFGSIEQSPQVIYNLNKWFCVSYYTNAGDITGTFISDGNSLPYAGSPAEQFAYTGGSSQIQISYFMRIY